MNDELKKQWDQDVADYGDNAHLMYELYSNNDESSGPVKNNKIIERLIYLGWFNFFRRNGSAELPFDLERAKAGDELEVNFGTEDNPNWVDCKFHCFVSPLVYCLAKGYGSIWCDPAFNYRMKYPPKISKSEIN